MLGWAGLGCVRVQGLHPYTRLCTVRGRAIGTLTARACVCTPVSAGLALKGSPPLLHSNFDPFNPRDHKTCFCSTLNTLDPRQPPSHTPPSPSDIPRPPDSEALILSPCDFRSGSPPRSPPANDSAHLTRPPLPPYLTCPDPPSPKRWTASPCRPRSSAGLVLSATALAEQSRLWAWQGAMLITVPHRYGYMDRSTMSDA